MNEKQSQQLVSGFYRLFWADGGSSLAAVGVCKDGGRWMAPINWVKPSSSQRNWKKVVHYVKLVECAESK